LKKEGWFDDNSGDETYPVAQKTPNSYGLYDMHGNVSEFVIPR
jgi:formylglycine-generating enzyme required for sulfatase activity